MPPSEILGLTFRQFTLYMDNINRINKMEQGENNNHPSTASLASIKNAMGKRGIRMPSRK